MKLRLNILLLFFFAQRTSSSFEASSALTKKLQNFINDRLGVQRMQDHLDASQFTTTPVESSNLLKTLSESLSVKFTERVEVVQKLRDEVEKRWASLSSSSHAAVSKCCSDLDIHEIDSNFQQIVDRTEACHHGQGLAMNPSKFVDNIIINVMKENLYQYPSIKFQYVGTEEGVTTVFPKFKTCSSTYDPRFRPWYVEAATPEPKDVVVVIDISGSMKNLFQKRTLLDIAKEAADTVITTLNPNDRVGIISFSDNANSATEDTNKINCKSTELAIATPHNKAYLKSYISSLNAHGGTIYSSALSLAFDFFSDSTANDQVILFLTDGKPGEDNQGILQTISQKNEKLGNKVAILTYGLGDSVGDDILRSIAQQTSHNATAGDIQIGIYARVSDPNNLRYEMASFYTFFGQSSRLNDPVFSVPYYDAFGLGLITSVCLPFYYKSNLKGVTCVDISMSDLLSDVAFFGRTDSSYAFIMDSVGRLLMHPLLPSPQSITDDPIFLQATSLETSPKAKDVIASMLRGESGSEAFPSLRVLSRGDSIVEGSLSTMFDSIYSWTQLTPHGFALCIVTVVDDIETLPSISANPYENFRYHRLDLDPNSEMCQYFGAAATIAGSTVHLSPAAFDKPYLQLIREETTLDVERYKSYFVGNRVSSSMFKGFVYDYVVLSAYFDDLLRQADDYEELLDSFIWAYVGFNVGVFRLYPGSRLVQDYEPVQRRWYKRALAQKGNIAFSTPYEDNFGAGAVITMSKTLYAGRSSRQHLDTDPVVGVMGLDFSMNVFYYYLTDTFTECEDRSYNGCFIIDDGGFVVMHRDWLNLQRPQDAYNIHISKKEPGVAKTLIENNIMQRRGCINHEQLLKQYTWLVSMQSDSLDYSNFVIYNIRETNLFVVLLKNRVDDIISACLQISASLPICVSYTEVECPCADKLEFSYCDNELEIDTDTDPPCAPFVDAAPMVGSFSSRSNLEPCHDYQCEGRPERECIVTTTCTWNGKSCSVHSPKEKGSSKTTVIAVVVVLLVVVAIAAVVGGLFYWKRKGSPATTSNSAGRSASYVNDSFDMGRHEPPPSYGDVCESNN